MIFPSLPADASAVAIVLVLVCLALALLLALAGLRLRRTAAAGEDWRAAAEAERLEAAALRARLEEREAELERLTGRAALLESNLGQALAARAALAAENALGEKTLRELREQWDKAQATLREAFGSLSREALARNGEMFLSLAKAQLGEFAKGAQAQLEDRRGAVDALVKPIGDNLGRMREWLEAAEKIRGADQAMLIAGQQALDASTRRLAQALHHSAARGRWGELQLRRVVEMAGMLEHCDFEEQLTLEERDGKRLRPDLIIHLVGGRNIVIDAKAPMESYLAAQEAPDDERERELRLRHAKAVRTHMGELGAKAYWSQFDAAPEFVVMFFPNEAVLADAFRTDPELMEEGVRRQVIPASPATLIALLKAAALGWRERRAAENAMKIFDLGRELYKRFGDAYRHLSQVGVSLARAV
ncbi:MAG: DNA recombination protein RmuC, partial [Planctomycetota bacterium]|nr:DNA recombination protein RmuC [Planctomycetota bacterium]